MRGVHVMIIEYLVSRGRRFAGRRKRLGIGNLCRKKLAAAGMLVAPIRLLWSCDFD